MDQRTIPDWMLAEIESVARSVANQWPFVTTPEDLQQSMVLRLLETRRSVEKLAAMELPQRRSALRKIGHQIASGDRDDYEQFTGQWHYSVDAVKKLLDDGGLVAERVSFDAAQLDLELGMAQLNSTYQKAIERRYVRGFPPVDDAERKRTERAVDALTRHMNRIRIREQAEYRNGGRRRSAVPSIAAQAVTEGDYEGLEAFDA